MKLREFMEDNIPMKKGSVKIPIEGVINTYRKRYDNLRKDSSRRFDFRIYTIMPGNRTLIHIKVPSETVTKFYYDVLLELEGIDTVRDILDCDIHIFSNCPSFVYTYAYVFYHLSVEGETITDKERKGLLIRRTQNKLPANRLLMEKEATEKLPDEALQSPPVVRNAYGIPLFDKSLYFAVFYIQEHIPLSVIKKKRLGTREDVLLAQIEDFDTLMIKRKAAAKKDADARKRANRLTTKEEPKSKSKTRSAVSIVKPSGAVKAVKSNQVKQVRPIRKIGVK